MSKAGTKQAFCLLRWRATGGKFDQERKPVFGPESQGASGLCTTPYDCKECPLMQEELEQLGPSSVMWVCPSCVMDLMREAKRVGIRVHLPGHYTEGVCEYPHCSRPPMRDIEGEHPARYSRFLQLAVGPFHH